ncbi:MAG TPA: hypothetical protein ENI37_06050 [Chloroflexi bacterium]|nr:hypothetical protein [Chloroflexota bacterium]
MIGETLGKYRIVEHLGHGGMAEVYKAHHPGLDRYVAIKVLHSFLASEENFLARFQREAKAVAGLRHPNIVQVYDFDYDQERSLYYMVMEFIDGPTLKGRLDELAACGERMPLDDAVRIAASVGEALDYAHRRGMVHRDVKPANIMFTSDGQAILTDFGIAKIVNVAGLTASGAMVGTPAYISPEQGLGQAGDERSDIYSLGIVLYQMITGVLPFDADTPMGVVLKHINEPLPSPRVVRPDLSVGLEQVLVRAMAKDPAQRYQTAAQFVADLRRAAAGQEIQPASLEATAVTPPLDQTVPMRPTPPGMLTPPPSPVPTPAPPPRRRMRWVVAGLVLIPLLLLVAGFLISGGRVDALLGSLMTSPTVAGTATPDMVATRLAATLAAVQATLEAPTPTPTTTPTSTPTSTPTPDLTATAAAACAFGVELVEDVPIRPSVLTPRQAFTKRWIVRNSGTCPWREDFALVFVSGERMGGPEALEVEPVEPGEEWEVVLELEAPAVYGTYISVWQFQDGEGQPLGEKLELELEVRVSPTPTPLPPTATPTPEFSPTPTEPLWMQQPSLIECYPSGTGYWGGRVAWGAGGGPSGEYRYFYGAVVPEQELEGPYNEFSGFPHIMTYFTVSGAIAWPVPEDCCPGDSGRWVAPEGYEVVWQKVQYVEGSCP